MLESLRGQPLSRNTSQYQSGTETCYGQIGPIGDQVASLTGIHDIYRYDTTSCINTSLMRHPPHPFLHRFTYLLHIHISLDRNHLVLMSQLLCHVMKMKAAPHAFHLQYDDCSISRRKEERKTQSPTVRGHEDGAMTDEVDLILERMYGRIKSCESYRDDFILRYSFWRGDCPCFWSNLLIFKSASSFSCKDPPIPIVACATSSGSLLMCRTSRHADHSPTFWAYKSSLDRESQRTLMGWRGRAET